jgi:hypothetical protein
MKFRKRTRPKTYLCETCHLSFATQDSFNSHTYFHDNPHRYICYLCEKSFSLKRGLGLHYQRDHTEILNQRVAARKHRKWLRSYLRQSLNEDDLSLGEMDEVNIDYVESLKSFRQTQLKQEAQWLARDFLSEDRLIIEEFYLSSPFI